MHVSGAGVRQQISEQKDRSVRLLRYSSLSRDRLEIAILRDSFKINPAAVEARLTRRRTARARTTTSQQKHPWLGVSAPASKRDPTMLARSLVARYGHHVQERVGAVYLDAKSRVIREREIYIGTLNSTTVSTRDIIRHAINDHAAALIVFHNHPSGDPSPSSEDLVFTKQLVDAGQLLGIEVLDHLILGINRYVSLKGMQAM